MDIDEIEKAKNNYDDFINNSQTLRASPIFVILGARSAT